jgi:hypothetical protein
MVKNILQDIVPPEKRSIRNIPIPNKLNRSGSVINDIKQTKRSEEFFEMPKQVMQSKEIPTIKKTEDDLNYRNDPIPRAYPYEDGEVKSSSRHSKTLIWGAVGLAMVIIGFAFASLFNGATVTVIPQQEKVEARSDTSVFTAKKDSPADGLTFQIITLKKTEGLEVPATGSENVERKASGTIIIYNTTSASEQRLIKNTRFQNAEGLIYRVNDSVVVPGSLTVDGKVTPGSVEVPVFADQAGEKYNIGKTDFTIPGFAGDPKFKTIYARSKTEMTGGFVGTIKKVSDIEASKAKEALEAKLAEALKNDAKSQVPADFIMFDDGLFYSFSTLPQSGGSDTSTTVNVEGTLNAIIFNKSVFAKTVASNLAPIVADTDVSIVGADNLTFAIVNKQSIESMNISEISFTLNGPLTFISQFDESRLKNDLLNKKKGELTTILLGYPSIKKADAVIRPFWKGTFPADINDIKVTIAPENN